VKTEEREQARQLRREQGLALNEISRRLGVAKSSVSHWVRDIELTPEQHDELLRRNPAYNSQRSGTWVQAERQRVRRLNFQQAGRVRARCDDAGFVAGCMLYWAEGAKNRNQVRLTNSDPEMVRFFVRFLRRYFGVHDSEIRITCNLFADHAERQQEIEQFWLDTAGVSSASLCKSTVNTYSKYSQKKRRNKLPYGTCKVSVCRTRIVQAIYGAIQEYAGFERPEWLDA
jgi:hypothetical protein